ncbi:hypothetical protein [Thermococcus gammatolerans]|uniref:Uncharacterized protein n=1 Tax=Thermococcus gammatolerans (strain DSM 15229 / JCM 11827 / EJ3) TaxID=593117 RepID=C5A6K0_THEGJ|nr:hypothetical protein [Thermococcus gammatolerans]ACS33862.1 Conserved hypothetical protein [Thermococcus gammatolerans EJ3]
MSYPFYTEESPRFKIAEYLKKITAVLLIVWLFKGYLGLEPYNRYLVYAIIALIFAFELLSVGRWLGVTVSGIIFALAKGFLWTSVFLYFGGWLGMPKDLHDLAGRAFAYAVVLTIAGLLVGRSEKRSFSWRVEKKAYEFNGADFGDVRLRGEGKAYPVKVGGKRVGWVIDGEIEVEAETPIGTIRKTLSSPVAVWGELRVGKKAKADDSFVEEANRLINPERLYRKTKGESVVDLGIIKVYEGEDFEYVKVPFVEVIETPHGEEVKIGPFRIHEGNPKKPEGMLTIRELRNGFQLTKVGDRLKVQTDEFSIEVDGNRVVYRSGNETLSLGEAVSLRSGDISVTVGRGRAKIRIEDVVISAKDGVVRIRAGGRTHTIENEEAYRLVMRKAKEIVDEQSAGLIEGLGVDRAMLGRRVRELLDELMNYVG